MGWSALEICLFSACVVAAYHTLVIKAFYKAK